MRLLSWSSSSHVERLAREGSDLASIYTCWMHGVEVLHSPYVMALLGLTQIFSPPLPKMPCCVDDCQRCAAHCWRVQVPLARPVE